MSPEMWSKKDTIVNVSGVCYLVFCGVIVIAIGLYGAVIFLTAFAFWMWQGAFVLLRNLF